MGYVDHRGINLLDCRTAGDIRRPDRIAWYAKTKVKIVAVQRRIRLVGIHGCCAGCCLQLRLIAYARRRSLGSRAQSLASSISIDDHKRPCSIQAPQIVAKPRQTVGSFVVWGCCHQLNKVFTSAKASRSRCARTVDAHDGAVPFEPDPKVPLWIKSNIVPSAGWRRRRQRTVQRNLATSLTALEPCAGRIAGYGKDVVEIQRALSAVSLAGIAEPEDSL